MGYIPPPPALFPPRRKNKEELLEDKQRQEFEIFLKKSIDKGAYKLERQDFIKELEKLGKYDPLKKIQQTS